MINRIKQKLQKLSPTLLEVIDESDLHRGHAGHHGNGVSHVRLRIASAIFEGLTRIESHRMIQDNLHDELESGLHALSINIIKQP